MFRASQTLTYRPPSDPAAIAAMRIKETYREIKLGLLRDVHGRKLVAMSYEDAERRLKERGFEE